MQRQWMQAIMRCSSSLLNLCSAAAQLCLDIRLLAGYTVASVVRGASLPGPECLRRVRCLEEALLMWKIHVPYSGQNETLAASTRGKLQFETALQCSRI